MSGPPDAKAPARETAGPREVSRFEARLLRVARFFLHQVPPEQAMPLVQEKMARPKCLSANCVHLLKDTLSKGCVLFLVRAGGWRRDRFLRGEKPTSGRLWQRWPEGERPLTFSRHVLEFLIWVTSNKVSESKPFWDVPRDELTGADQLFLFLAFQELQYDAELRTAITTPGSPFTRNALCWLAYPDSLADLGPEAVPDFSPWMSGLGACVLEALQPYLAGRWLDIERGKGQIGDWHRMRVNGIVQERVLQQYTHAAETAGRYDLARFLLRTTSQVLSVPNLPLTFWTGGLSGNAPTRLADRLATQRAALVLARHLEVLHGWERRCRSVGYYDEGYAASQLWLSDWEEHGGPTIAMRAEAIVGQLQPLRVGGGGTSPPTGGTPPAEPTA